MAQANRVELISRIADDMWNRGNIDAADDIMHADARYHGPHMPNGTGGRED